MRFPRAPIVPAAGGGDHFPAAWKSIRLARHGCANRPFYHIVVLMSKRHQHERPIEQLGTFDPYPNKFNEKLVSVNIERLKYWLAHRTTCSRPVAHLLGLMGVLPIHPRSYIRAWRNREILEETIRAEGKSKENAEKEVTN